MKRIFALILSIFILCMCSTALAEDDTFVLYEAKLTSDTDEYEILYQDDLRAMFTVCAYIDTALDINEIETIFGISMDDMKTMFRSSTYVCTSDPTTGYVVWAKLADDTVVQIMHKRGVAKNQFSLMQFDDYIIENWEILDTFDIKGLYKNDPTSVSLVIETLSGSTDEVGDLFEQ